MKPAAIAVSVASLAVSALAYQYWHPSHRSAKPDNFHDAITDSSVDGKAARQEYEGARGIRRIIGAAGKVGGIDDGLETRVDALPGVPVAPGDFPMAEPRLEPYPSKELFAARDLAIQRAIKALVFKPGQLRILSDLESLGVSNVDVWHGSHLVLKGDGGAYYRKWRDLGAKRRISSHYAGVVANQYEFPFFRHGFLFGVNRAGDTWLQMENYAGRDSIVGGVKHVITYFQAELAGLYMGPLGYSPHRENSRPLVINASAVSPAFPPSDGR